MTVAREMIEYDKLRADFNDEIRDTIAEWLSRPYCPFGADTAGVILEEARKQCEGPPSQRTKARIPHPLRKAVFERDAYRCQDCDGHTDLSIDHVIAEANGGETCLENLQTLCLSCNCRKGTR